MDEEIEVPQSGHKISDAEVILIGLFFAGICAINLIPGAGDITDFITAPMGFYYWTKGLNGITFIVSEILDLIPGPQEIPWLLISWIATVYIDRHPKFEAKLGSAIAIGNAIEGNFGGAEGELAGEAQLASAGNTSLNVADAESGTLTAAERGGAGETPEANSRPSETDTEREGRSAGSENAQDEGIRAEQKAADSLRQGDEVSPEEQMQEQNFGPLEDEPSEEIADDENVEPASSALADSQSGNNVVDIAAARAKQNRKNFVADKIPQDATEDLAA